MFYSEEDFDYELDLIEGYVEEDINQTVVVYEVDRTKTNVNAIYKETSGEVRYKAPREIPCLYEIKAPEIKAFDSTSSNATYTQDGNLTIYVMLRTFEKYRVDIRKGDYIGVHIAPNKMRYFTVVNDGKVNSANTHLVGGYRHAWRTIECTLVSDTTEFNG